MLGVAIELLFVIALGDADWDWEEKVGELRLQTTDSLIHLEQSTLGF